jgi:hypothetical protein
LATTQAGDIDDWYLLCQLCSLLHYSEPTDLFSVGDTPPKSKNYYHLQSPKGNAQLLPIARFSDSVHQGGWQV